MIAPVTSDLAAHARLPVAPAAARGESASFGEELARARAETSEVRFSAHAQRRMADRSIALTDSDRARIAQSTDLAASKGAREALVLMDRLALVVGVPSRTVITVMEPQDGGGAVFTHIDSVVMAPRGE